MKFRIVILFFLLFSLTSNQSKKKRQDIDLVFCLDLSSSTNGLLPVFKKHFWEVIYDFNRYYPLVNLKIGLIVYGRPSFDKKNDYVRLISDLTSDYESIFHEVSKFRTNITQGEAWLDAAISGSINLINWNDNALKHVYFIGNGPPRGKTNSSASYIKKCKTDIRFNFLFYNSYNNQKDKNGWKELAELGKGNYSEFNFQPTKIQFVKKYDLEWIMDLGDMINDSYITYGEHGKDHFNVSLENDSICATLGEDCLESRMIYKASRFYQNNNAHWDLIDLFATKPIDPYKIQEQEVSKTIKSMKPGDLVKYLQLKKLDRKQLLGEMAKHSAKRDLYLYKKHAKLKIFNQQSYYYQALISSLEKGLSSHFKITY